MATIKGTKGPSSKNQRGEKSIHSKADGKVSSRDKLASHRSQASHKLKGGDPRPFRRVRPMDPAPAGESTELGSALIQGLREAVAISKGELEPTRRFDAREVIGVTSPAFTPDEVRGLREKLGVSQSVLASAVDVDTRSVSNWEQGIRNPDGPAKRVMYLLTLQPNLLSVLLLTKAK